MFLNSSATAWYDQYKKYKKYKKIDRRKGEKLPLRLIAY